MKIVLFFTVCIIIMHVSVTAQVKIGNNPTTINSASLLELETTNQGFVLPRVSISDVSSSLPLAAGLLTGTVVYNISSTTTGGSGAGIYLWDGSKWLPLSTGISVSSSAWLLTGNSGLNAATNFIGTTDAIDFVARTANTERMRILGAASGSSKAGWIGMGITIPRSSLDIQGHYTNKNVLTIENSSTSGYSSVDMMDSAGNLKGTFGYANLGTGGIFAGKDYFNIYTNDFLFTTNLGNNDFYMKGSTGFIGLNTNAPSERLHVVGNFYLNGAFMPGGSAGTSGYVLTSAGAGLSPTWTATTNFAWSLTGNAGTTSSNFLGTTDAQNLRFKVNNQLSGLIDYSANSITTFGYQAGLNNGTTTGTTAFGWKALTANTTGQNNTAIGDNTMASNTTGGSNTALGFNTLAASITGGANTALGYGTLIANTASFNTGGGYLSLNNNISGAGNTAFGSNALSTNTTGSNNTAIGYNADVSAAGLTNATAIGYNAKAGASNTVILGSGDAKVGINTSTPAQKLEIAGIGGTIRAGGLASGGSFNNALTTTSSNFLYVNNATGDMYSLPTVNSAILVTGATGIPSWSTTALSSNAWLLTGNSATSYTTNFLGTKDNVSLRFRTNNAERMIIDSLGKIGIGLSNPAYALSVLSASNPLYLSGVQATATFTIDSILTINNGVVKKAANSSLTNNFWSLTGNSGTSYLTNFLGTTDNVSLRFRTNSLQRMIIDSLGRVGIGLSNPSYALSVLSALNPLYLSGVQATSTLTADSVLTINAGIVKKTSYNSLTGNFWSLNGNAGTNASNFLGTTDGVNLQFKVNNSLSGLIDFSNSITTFGYQAGLNNGSVTGTTAFGWSALTSNAKGDNNTAVGNNSMSANVSGASNTAIGYNTLSSNDAGNYNTALGNESLLRNNASNNTAGGYLSLNSNITGQGNTAFGVSTLITNATGDYNTAIGYNADVLKDGFTNATAIGYNAKAGASNTVILGSDKADVGIGTSAPARKLEVAGSSSTIRLGGVASGGAFNNASTATTSNLLYTDNSTGDLYALPTVNNGILVTNSSGVPSWSATALSSKAWLLTGNSGTSYATNFLGTTDNVSIRFRTNNIQRVIIDSLGNVGIGLSNPSYALSVLSASNPLYLSGVQATAAFTTDSLLTIFNGVVKKAPNSALANASWSLTGNSGTSYTTNFLGTKDNVSLRFRTNNIERMIIDSVGSIGIGSSAFNAINKEKILIDYGATTSHTLASLTGSIDDYFQINMQNKSSGVNASTDYVATADDGTEDTYYVDMGINSSTYAPGVENWGSQHDAYLYASSRNLLIGCQSLNSDLIFLLAGGKIRTNTVLRLKGENGNVIVGAGENSATPIGNIIRGPNGSGTNITGGSLTLQGGLSSGTATGANIYINGGASASGTAGAVIFNTAAAERMRIDATGNIGMGTTNPLNRLSVLAASNPLYLSGVQSTAAFTTDSVLTIYNGVVKKAAYSSLSGAGNWSLTGNSGTSYTTNFLGTTDNVSLRFRTNNVQRMIIDSLGKVGIGTSSPASDLTIYQSSGSGSSKGFTFTGNSIGGTNSGTGFLMSLGYNIAGNKQLWVGDADYAGNVSGSFARFVVTGATFPVLDAVSGDNAFRRYLALGVAGDANSGVIFGNDNTAVNPGSQVWDNGNMTIGSAYKSYVAPSNGLLVQGNVGIGTAAPSSALSILAASNPLYLSGVQATASFSTDSVLTILNGVVKKTPYSSLPGAGAGWSLTGNTIAVGNFLGSINALPLILKANNVQMGYFDGNVSSLALGVGAINNSSDHNVAIGYNANTNNQYCLALGYNAAASGVRSVAIGNGIKPTAASGAESIAIGFNAISSGDQSISLGYQSTGSGQYSLALGYTAQASALQSTAIGYSSLASAQYSTAIGYQAQATALQSTAIGYHAQTAQTNTILLGDVSTPNLYVGIGTASPTAKLHIVGGTTTNYPLQMTGLPTGSLSDNLLTINASGIVGSVSSATANGTYWNLSGNTATASSFLGTTNAFALQFKYNSTLAGYLDANNTAFGTSSSATTGTSNTAIGYSATASNNATAIGANAVASQANNIAIGNSALANTSSQATAIGASSQALFQNNVAVGYNAQATVSSQETVIGSFAQAQGLNNIAIGYSAKANGSDKITVIGTSAQASFQNNTVVGYSASAAVNNQSTAIGASSNAGAQNATALGYNASATGVNSTAIGNSAATSQANALILGNNSANVGIGTSTPNTTAKLDVDGSFKMGDIGTVNKNVVSFASASSTVSVTAGTFDKSGVGGYTSGFTDITITIPFASNYLTSTQATVSVSPSADLPANVHIAYAKMISTSQLKIRLMNGSSAVQSFTSQFYITINEF